MIPVQDGEREAVLKTALAKLATRSRTPPWGARLTLDETIDLRDYVAGLVVERDAAERERDEYRIEADCGLRDFDDLELRFGQAVDALNAIAAGRPNKRFDPWARDLARSVTAEVKRD